MKPVIGMTAMPHEDASSKVFQTNQTYVNAILNAGGLPLLLPAKGSENDCLELAEHLDGLLVPGGADVSTLLYGEEALQPVTMMNSSNDRFEIALIRRMAELNKPIIGICRGIQVINVAFGGSLYQDIPSQIQTKQNHYQKGPRYEPFHYVELEEGSKLADIFHCRTLAVNTFHHQSVKDVADGFRVTAKAHDGVIEAIEHKEKYILGVQWHPECMVDVHDEFIPFFDNFIQEAAKQTH